MIRVNALIKSNAYQHFLEQNRMRELDRKFCRHGFDHMLDVARIAYIYLLEERIKNNELIERDKKVTNLLTKEVVYAAGLLHDVGRWVQYETGEDHAEASARLAEPLLLDYGFSVAESSLILDAIKEHRSKRRQEALADELKPLEGTNPMVKAIALADDWSRDCLNCQAQPDCYKVNMNLTSEWCLTF